MEGKKEKARDQTEGSGQQQPVGQESTKSEYGSIDGPDTDKSAAVQSPSGSEFAERRGEESAFGQPGQSATGETDTSPQPGAGSAPPRSAGLRGPEFGHTHDRGTEGQQGQSGTGQADLGSQAGSTLAGRTDQQDLDPDNPVDQPGSYAGGLSGRQAERPDEGFIAQPTTGTDEDLEERESQGFAPEGQGAMADTERTGSSDVEREFERTANRDSDIEGGSGNV